jgi:hypothetical protein
MNEHFIGRLYLLKVMSAMTLLPTRLLPALLAQALGGTHKAIGGRRQTPIVTIFGLLPLERFHALLQILNRLNSLCESFA